MPVKIPTIRDQRRTIPAVDSTEMEMELVALAVASRADSATSKEASAAETNLEDSEGITSLEVSKEIISGVDPVKVDSKVVNDPDISNQKLTILAEESTEMALEGLAVPAVWEATADDRDWAELEIRMEAADKLETLLMAS